jgi:hypothetical protein
MFEKSHYLSLFLLLASFFLFLAVYGYNGSYDLNRQVLAKYLADFISLFLSDPLEYKTASVSSMVINEHLAMQVLFIVAAIMSSSAWLVAWWHKVKYGANKHCLTLSYSGVLLTIFIAKVTDDIGMYNT